MKRASFPFDRRVDHRLVVHREEKRVVARHLLVVVSLVGRPPGDALTEILDDPCSLPDRADGEGAGALDLRRAELEVRIRLLLPRIARVDPALRSPQSACRSVAMPPARLPGFLPFRFVAISSGQFRTCLSVGLRGVAKRQQRGRLELVLHLHRGELVGRMLGCQPLRERVAPGMTSRVLATGVPQRIRLVPPPFGLGRDGRAPTPSRTRSTARRASRRTSRTARRRACARAPARTS